MKLVIDVSILIIICLTLAMNNLFFSLIPLWKHQKTLSFLTFSLGIKRKNWKEMGRSFLCQWSHLFQCVLVSVNISRKTTVLEYLFNKVADLQVYRCLHENTHAEAWFFAEICCIFSEYFFLRQPLESCFWI